MDRGAWWATVQGLQRVRQDSVTIQQQNILHIIYRDNTYVCEWIIYMYGYYIWLNIYIYLDGSYIYMDNTHIDDGYMYIKYIHMYKYVLKLGRIMAMQ